MFVKLPVVTLSFVYLIKLQETVFFLVYVVGSSKTLDLLISWRFILLSPLSWFALTRYASR